MKAKTIPVLAGLMIALFAGCKEDEATASVTPTPQGYPIGPIVVWNYVSDHYFVDTLYRGTFENYYGADPPVLSPDIQVVDEEVWVQKFPPFGTRTGVAFITLPPRPPQGYDPALRNLESIPGERESAPFARLNREEYDVWGDGYVGVISLRVPTFENQVVGVAYRRRDGTQFGEFAGDVPDTSTVIVLKMLKPRFLNLVGPVYRVAWNQLLKNVYPVGGRRIKEYGFSLDITYGSTPGESQSLIMNQPLLRVLGLDRYTQDGTPALNGDGLFDFRPGITIDQDRGELILPSLRPFDEGIRKYFTDRGLPVPDSTYFNPWIYDSTRAFAQARVGKTYSFNGRTFTY